MMAQSIRTKIVATGSYIPTRRIANDHFLDHQFFDEKGRLFELNTNQIIAKFEAITGIKERRYVTDDLETSDIGTRAAEDALQTSEIDPESLDCIVFAHNFGDVGTGGWSNLVPSLAARVKQKLGIRNPRTLAYDLPFGCPGWLQGVIQADLFIKVGQIKRALIVGAEVLSRVLDPHDRDSMIYADGAGACIVEGSEDEDTTGILAHYTRCDTENHAYSLRMGRSYNPHFENGRLFLKMHGHRVYEYAVRTVPSAIKECLIKAGVTIQEVAKILVHQANSKMDDAIVTRVYNLFGIDTTPDGVVPSTISWLGNSSVATLPTLADLLLKGRLAGHRLTSGQTVLFASVGAGMNVNSLVYRLP